MQLKTILPHVMAVINASTLLVLFAGFSAIRRGDKERHKACMYVAIGLGTAFLALYVTYHLGAGLAKFGGEGLVRPVYFSILIVHIIAAAAAAVIVPIAVLHALGKRFEKHRAVALKTWKLWVFVTVSGIIVYIMTIHVWPYQGA